MRHMLSEEEQREFNKNNRVFINSCVISTKDSHGNHTVLVSKTNNSYHDNMLVNNQEKIHDQLLEIARVLKIIDPSTFSGITGLVVIDKARYESLIDTENQLEHLESEGVDNWSGYSRYDSEDDDDE